MLKQKTYPVRPVPFRALGGIFEADDVAAAARVTEAAASEGGNFFPLPEETQFQQAFADHEGARFAVAVNSCGTALDLCMMALGIGKGDEVITTPLTFVCTATCAAARGAKVIFADIDRQTLCLDPQAVAAKVTPRTKAIIPVHFAGHAADIDAFADISRRTGVPVIYDAAHAVGARRSDRAIGAAGLASCYSFQSNKNITTLGEGGAATTDDADFAERVRQKKTFGYVYGPKLRVVTIGFNYRMTKPQLAVGLTQIAKAKRINQAKLAKMRLLDEVLAGIDEIIRPAGLVSGHAAHLYVMRIDTKRTSINREMLQAHLKEKYQVGTAIHYQAVWDWEAMSEVEHDRSDCPIATEACRSVLSLPVFAQSHSDDLEYVAWAIKQSFVDLKR